MQGRLTEGKAQYSWSPSTKTVTYICICTTF